MRSTGRSRRLSITASSDRSNTGELMQEEGEIDFLAPRITEHSYILVREARKVFSYGFPGSRIPRQKLLLR